jgi:ribulose 1,5-bisphosphate synthetase/thiazole synthase
MSIKFRFGENPEVITQLESEIPLVDQVDVLVAGGGVAGLGAAVGAGRTGAKTLLIEGQGFLGGAATASMMNLWVLSHEYVNGIAKEIYERLSEIKGAILGKVVPYEIEAFKTLSLELLQEASVNPLFYTSVVDVIKKGDRVVGVVVESKSGRQAILAKCVVDTTGDADVSAQSGVPCIKGRETDNKMRPITQMFRMENVDIEKISEYRDEHPEEFSPDDSHNVLDLQKGIVRLDGFFSLTEAARERGEIDENCHYLRLYGIAHSGRGIITINSTRIYNVDGTSVEDLTRSSLEGQKQVLKLVRFLKRDIPGFEESFLLDCAPVLGVRETRRIRGEYVLSEDDVTTPVVFSDSIAREYSFVPRGIETHSPNGGEGGPGDLLVRGLKLDLREYFIPYRSLVPLHTEGLLVGGRCISVTHEADNWTRTQTTCMNIGQAAGIAAGISAQRKVLPRNLDTRLIQQELNRQGVDLGRAILQTEQNT